MSHPAGSTVAGKLIPRITDGTRPVIVIDIQQIMNQARMSTESIIRIVEIYGDTLEGVDNTAIIYLNSMATPMLQNLYLNLQSLQRQMVIYASAVNPESTNCNRAHNSNSVLRRDHGRPT